MDTVIEFFTAQEALFALGMSILVFVMIFCVLYFAYEVSKMDAQNDAMTQLDKEEDETWN